MGRYLVTGGSGFLGTAICRLLTARGEGQVYAGYFSHKPHYGVGLRFDLRDGGAVAAAVQAARPEVVIHTAYTQQADQQQAVIVEGTRRLAERARDKRFVQISTDWVFDGCAGPYGEDDAAVPNSAYGRAKLAAEGHAQGCCEDAVVIRTSLINGSAPLPPRWLAEEEKLRGGEKVVFFSNEIRNPIHVDDLAAAVVEVADSDYRGLLHVAGPRYLSRFAELRLFVRWRGISEELIGSNVSQGAGRPLDCSLKTERFRERFRTSLRGPEEYWV